MTASDASKPRGGRGKPLIGQLLFREAGAELLNLVRELPADASLEDFRRAVASRADRGGVAFFAGVAGYQDGERESGLRLVGGQVHMSFHVRRDV